MYKSKNKIDMFKQLPCYTIICDGCKKDAFENSDHAGYSTATEALGMAEYWHEFVKHKDKHYCYDCAKKFVNEEVDDEIEFQRCSDCDGHDACEDFGCAIKGGIIKPKW